MLHTPDIYTSLYPYSILKGSCCTIASLVQAPWPLTTRERSWFPSVVPWTQTWDQVLMPSLHVGPLLGNPLAAFLPVQSTGRGRDRRLLPKLDVVVQLQWGKGKTSGSRHLKRVVDGGGQRWSWYTPRLLTHPLPPCRSRLIRCLGAPSAPAPSSRTARSGSLRSGGRRWGGTAWIRRSWSSWHWRRGWADSGPEMGSEGRPRGEEMSDRCTVPANENVHVSWPSFRALPREKVKLVDEGLYLCVDVCAEANEAFDQRNVAVNGCQVETVVSWSEKK